MTERITNPAQRAVKVFETFDAVHTSGAEGKVNQAMLDDPKSGWSRKGSAPESDPASGKSRFRGGGDDG